MIERHRSIDRWLQTADAVIQGTNDQIEVLPQLYARLPKERGLKLDIRHGWIFGTYFVMLADYLPDLQAHGDRLVLCRDTLHEVVEQLGQLDRSLGGLRQADAGQGRLFL